jgi:hypothetical protein
VHLAQPFGRFLFCSISAAIALASTGCEGPQGACVDSDGTSCKEDTKSYCEAGTFHAEKTCSQQGFPRRDGALHFKPLPALPTLPPLQIPSAPKLPPPPSK